jgi:hypothetical protein
VIASLRSLDESPLVHVPLAPTGRPGRLTRYGVAVEPSVPSLGHEHAMRDGARRGRLATA